MTTLRIAWRNLGRNRKRSLLAIGAICLGQATLVFVNGLMAGMFDQMLRTVTGPMMGHVVAHHPDWREERAADLYLANLGEVRAQIAAVPGVASVSPRLYSGALAASGEKGDEPATAEPAFVVGVDVALEMGGGGLLEGLDEGKMPQGDRVAIGRILANRIRAEEGQQLAVIGQDVDGFPASDLFTIAAILDSPVDLVQTGGVVMCFERAGEFLAMPNHAHEVLVRAERGDRSEELAREIAALPALADAEVLPWQEAAPELARFIGMKDLIDMIFVGIVFIAAAAGIANTSMMSTFERTHEFGMLLAIGSRPGKVVSMVLLESVFLGLIGVALGSLLGTAAVLTTGWTGINWAAFAGVDAEDMALVGMRLSLVLYPRFEMRHVLFGLAAVTLTSVLAATWPATLAARLEPAKAMRP